MAQLQSTVRTLVTPGVRGARGVVKRVLRPFRGPIGRLRRKLPRRVDRTLVRIMGGPRAQARRPGPPPPPPELVEQARAARPDVPATGTRLYVGPANFADQGRLWARAAEAHLPDVGAVNMSRDLGGGPRFEADYTVAEQVYLNAPDWQREQVEYVKGGFTHVLIEAQRPLFGRLYAHNAFTEARVLTGYGMKVATIAHGRDVRLPSRHRENYEWSPYISEEWAEVDVLELQVRRNLAGLAALDLPAFVSTPDLLDDLPDAVWCPVVIDTAMWQTDEPPMTSPVPVVVHAPTNAKFKGSDQIDPVMQALHDDGVIRYRRISNVSREEMAQIIRSADIVLEQFRLGSYGATACEGMAAGRIVLGHVAEHNRQRVLKASGLELPIVETTVDRIREVVLGLIDDRDRARELAADGPAYVAGLHDGSFSAGVLSSFLLGGPSQRA